MPPVIPPVIPPITPPMPGIVHPLTSTAIIDNPIGDDSVIRTVTVTARDNYSTPIVGYQFKIDITITNNDPAHDETYSVKGVARTTTISDVQLDATNAQGQTTFAIEIVTSGADFDSGDGLSVQVKTVDGQAIGSPFTFIKP
ncbi:MULTISPECIES: hypothetical protein [Brevibacillus]|uniref:hypothetical protein n=1 Tax=Brevibacillus TaxID=55080 RepID=UPI002475D58E|nr:MULTISPECIES: hypothetical protein [Brevibacillus]MDH6350425.1 hypothetical protein [Brevibacillus sp. 1238]MED2258416.1 hypothetical protein [Brevibacillus parabrevis]